jgi:hypothetical protein
LPAFSNSVKEDQYTAAQWLQKVLLHRQAAAWNDEQIITHFRNALKDKVINWFDSLPALNVSQHVWQEIQTRFEIDYKAKATATSIVAKLPEVKQAADESVNDYFSRATQILWELKSNIDPALIEIPDVVLPADEAAIWTAIHANIRNAVVNHVRAHASARSCEQYNAIILTAGFKPSIKTKIMGANLHVLADIKDLALKTETLEIEKRGKTNASNLMVNPVEENDDVDALYQGQRSRGSYRGGYRGGSGPPRGNCGGYNGGDRSSYRKDQKPDQYSKNRGDSSNNTQNKPQNGQATAPYKGGNNSNQNNDGRKSNSSGQQNRMEKWCANCRKSTHNTAQCWGNKKKTVNCVNNEEEEQPQDQEDKPQCDTIHSFFKAKN